VNRRFKFQKRRQLCISDFQFAKVVQSIDETNCPFQFHKRRQLFIRVQRNAFRRRGVRQQSRSSALHDPKLRRSPTPTGFA
jgi:hypothetical protein